MKLKFPKKVRIGDAILYVKLDKSYGGGSLNFDKQELIIGTKHLKRDPTRVLAVILHELTEAIAIDMMIRYWCPNETTMYKFFMDHKDFTVLNARVAGLLKKFIK